MISTTGSITLRLDCSSIRIFIHKLSFALSIIYIKLLLYLCPGLGAVFQLQLCQGPHEASLPLIHHHQAVHISLQDASLHSSEDAVMLAHLLATKHPHKPPSQ